MKKKKLGIISIFLVFAMLISSVLPYSGDMAAAKGKNIVSKAKEEWEFSVNSDIPLDKICACSSSDAEGKRYYYGYKDGKVAVLDEGFQCHTNTAFDGVKEEWHSDNSEDLIIKGKSAIIAYKDVIVEDEDGEEDETRYWGIMSCTGETVVEPQFDSIEIDTYNKWLELETKDGKKGIWNFELEELVPCQYDDIDYDFNEKGQKVFCAHNEKEMVVVFERKVIWREKYDRKIIGHVSACFDKYEEKECVRIGISIKKDEEDDGESKNYLKYIAYDGTELLDWVDGTEWDKEQDKKENEEYEKKLEQNKQWLAEQGTEDEKEVTVFFEKNGVELSNIKTSYEIQEPTNSSQPNWYYWVILSAEYEDTGNKSKGKLIYVLIYNEDRKRLLAGRSFGQDKEYGYFTITNDYECLVLLTNDGELCYLAQYDQKIVPLCKIDESDGLTYLYIKDISNSNQNKKSDNGHTEAHQLYFEKDGEHTLGRYVEVRLVNGAFQETRHDYWVDYYKGKAYEGNYIVGIYNSGEYYFVENADAGIDIYRWGIAEDDFVGHLDCSADEFEQIKIKEMVLDDEDEYEHLLFLWCNEHKKVAFLDHDKYCQTGYRELGISEDLSEDSVISRVLSEPFNGLYVIEVNDVDWCLNMRDGELTSLSRIDEATAKNIMKAEGTGVMDEIRTADKVYLTKGKEKSVVIIIIDKETLGVTAKNVPINGGNLESVHAAGDKCFVQYSGDSGYGILDIEGKDQGLSGRRPARFAGDYIIQDGVLYDLSCHPIANRIVFLNNSIDVDDEDREYCIVASEDKSSEFKPVVINSFTGKNVYSLPDNIFVCDDVEEDIAGGEWEKVFRFANGFLGINFGVNGQERTLLLDDSDRVLFYGEAYIYQDEKEHKITVYGKDIRGLEQEQPDKAVGVNVAYRTQKEIRDYAKKSGVSLKDALTFAENPITAEPYALGKLSDKTLKSAADMLNQIRYIAGIPDGVELSDSYNELAQAAALSNYANNDLSHFPVQPAGMPDDMYALAKEGASSSNISWASWAGRSLNDTIVSGWMKDGSDGNIPMVGHRRWILNPSMGKTGFGAVSGQNGTYSAMYTFDRSNSGAQEYGVMWPAQNMPVEYFDKEYPWSISMGYNVDESKVQVALTRKKDGKKWSFSKASADGDFYVNNDGYGQEGCIIFRPDSGIDGYSAGEEFKVEITGLEQGDVSYTVHFFAFAGEETPTPKPTTVPDDPYIPFKPVIIPTSSPSATPKPSVSPSVLPTADPSNEPSVTPSEEPVTTPLPTVTPEPSEEPSYTPEPGNTDTSGKLKKGSKVRDKKTKAVYQVTGVGSNKAVEYIRGTQKNRKNAIIPTTVRLQGNTFKVTSIGKNAFKGNKKLKNVSIGGNVKKVGKSAFDGCKKLKKVTLGKNVAAIGANAFRGCSDLTMVTIPSKVKKIGAKAFYQCRNLRFIMVKTNKLTPKSIGKNAFSGGYRLPRVKTDKKIWRKYSRIFLKSGISRKALFIIDPVKLVI